MSRSFEKIHEFEVWYTHITEDDIVYSCSDDMSFKKLDLRQPESLIYTN
jgi:hypothetical protein